MGRIFDVYIQYRELQWLVMVIVIGGGLGIIAYGIRYRRDELEQHTKWMNTIAENVMDLILILDEKGKIQYITPSITRFLKYKDEEIRGGAIWDYIHPMDRKTVMGSFQSEIEKHGKIEGRFLHKDGYYVYLSAKVKHLYDEMGNDAGAVISCQDITERKRMENRLLKLRFKDVVTGLHNRGYFEEKVAKYLEEENFPLSVIVGDIDDLKKVNDTHGHLRGDKLLGYMGRALKSNCRKEDLICRMGGDEFVMLLPRTTEEEVKKVTERIEKDVDSLDCNYVSCGISLGTYTAEKPVSCIEEILGIADRNMYQKKEKRKQAG